METKHCYRCKTIKPKSAFSKANGRYDGCAVYCKKCQSKISKIDYKKTLSKKNCRECRKSFIGGKNKLFCSSICARKKLIKPISGYKECFYCKKEFPFRETALVRSQISKGKRIGSVKQKFCSSKCRIKYLPIEYKNFLSKHPEHRKVISERATKTFKGRKLTLKQRLSRKGRYAGEKSHFWKGGVTPINKVIRQSLKYKLWREKVFKRDNWTCIWCKNRGGRLHADHIQPFAYFPKLRFNINNGRTLCEPCHKTTDTYLKNGYNKNRTDERGLAQSELATGNGDKDD